MRCRHYHCRRVCYDWEAGYNGQMLHDVLAEEIEKVSTRDPFVFSLEQEDQVAISFYSSGADFVT